MKHLLYILFTVASFIAQAQLDTSIESFRKSMYVNIKKPWTYTGDSCRYCITLLKMDIDQQYHLKVIQLADNAEEWFVDDFAKMQKEKVINFSKIEEYAKRKKIKNASILMPIALWFSEGNCLGRTGYWLDNRYFQFLGKPLSGNCVFLDFWASYPIKK